MDVATITSLIGSLGFPIVVCGILAFYVKHITDSNREDMNKINNEHKEELKEMMSFKNDITKALENNTTALNNLCKEIERRNEKNG